MDPQFDSTEAAALAEWGQTPDPDARVVQVTVRAPRFDFTMTDAHEFPGEFWQRAFQVHPTST